MPAFRRKGGKTPWSSPSPRRPTIPLTEALSIQKQFPRPASRQAGPELLRRRTSLSNFTSMMEQQQRRAQEEQRRQQQQTQFEMQRQQRMQQIAQAEQARRFQESQAAEQQRRAFAMQQEERQRIVAEQRRQHLEELVRGFEPDEPSDFYKTAVANRPQIPLDRLEDEARRAEGVANLKKFKSQMDRMAPTERAFFAPLSRALIKHGLTAQEYGDALRTFQEDPDRLEERFSPSQISRINKATKEAGPIQIGPTNFVEGIRLPERKGIGGYFDKIGDTLGEAARELPARGDNPLEFAKSAVTAPLRVGRRALELEQEIIPRRAREEALNVLLPHGPNNMGEGIRDKVIDAVAPYAVPSTLIPGPQKAGKLGLLAKVGFEGLINLEQERALRRSEGKPDLSKEEALTIFATAGGIRGVGDVAGGVIKRRLQDSAIREGAEAAFDASKDAVRSVPPTRIGREFVEEARERVDPNRITIGTEEGGDIAGDLGRGPVVTPLLRSDGKPAPIKKGTLVALRDEPDKVFGEVMSRSSDGFRIRTRDGKLVHKFRNAVHPVEEGSPRNNEYVKVYRGVTGGGKDDVADSSDMPPGNWWTTDYESALHYANGNPEDVFETTIPTSYIPEEEGEAFFGTLSSEITRNATRSADKVTETEADLLKHDAKVERLREINNILENDKDFPGLRSEEEIGELVAERTRLAGVDKGRVASLEEADIPELQSEKELLDSLKDVPLPKTISSSSDAVVDAAYGAKGTVSSSPKLDLTDTEMPTPGNRPPRHVLRTPAGDMLEYRENHIVDVNVVEQRKGTGTAILNDAIERIRKENPEAVITADLNTEGGVRLVGKRPEVRFLDRTTGNEITQDEAIRLANAGKGPQAEIPPVEGATPSSSSPPLTIEDALDELSGTTTEESNIAKIVSSYSKTKAPGGKIVDDMTPKEKKQWFTGVAREAAALGRAIKETLTSHASRSAEALSLLEHNLIEVTAETSPGRLVQKIKPSAKGVQFSIDSKTGIITGPISRKGALKTPIHFQEVRENPDFFNMTPELRKYLDEAYVRRAQFINQAIRAKVPGFAQEWFTDLSSPLKGTGRYANRVVVAADGEGVSFLKGGIGSKQSLIKPRKIPEGEFPEGIDYAQAESASLQALGMQIAKMTGDNAFATKVKGIGRAADTSGVPEQYSEARKQADSAVGKAETALKRNQENINKLKTARRALTGQKNADKASRASAAIADLESKRPGLEEAVTKAKENLAIAKKEKSADVRMRRDPQLGEGRISNIPALANTIFDKEAKKAIEGTQRPIFEVAGKEISVIAPVLDIMTKINAPFRQLWAGLDASYTALQTLTTAKNPRAWLKMQGIGFHSLTDPAEYYKYVRDNEKVIEEIIDAGGKWNGTNVAFDAISNLSGNKFDRYTGIKMTNDLWNRAINVAFTEQYKLSLKAMEGMDDKAASAIVGRFSRSIGFKPTETDPKRQLVRAISHGLGRLSIDELAKEGPIKRSFVGALPFAGHYWDAWGRLLVDLSKGGMQGHQARQMVAGWLAIGVGLYTASSLALEQAGIGDGPEFEGTNALTYNIGGIRYGVGGPIQKLIAVSTKIKKDPSKAPNILTRTARGMSSPAMSLIADILIQTAVTTTLGEEGQVGKPRTYLGDSLLVPENMAAYAVTRFAPGFVTHDPLEALITEGPDAAKEALKEAPVTAVGGRAYPVSPYEKLRENRNEATRSLYEKNPTLFSGMEKAGLDPTSYEDVANWDHSLSSLINDSSSIQENLLSIREEAEKNPTSAYFEAMDKKMEEDLLAQKRDDQLLKNYRENKRGGISPEEWQKRTTSRLAERQIFKQDLEDRYGVEFKSAFHPDSPNSVVERMFAISPDHPDYIDPEDGSIDWNSFIEDREEILSSLDRKTKERVEDYLEKNMSPLQKERKNDLELIRNSGWWELDEKAWNQVRTLTADVPRDRRVYLRQQIDNWADMLADSYGLSPTSPEVIATARDRAQTKGLMKPYNRIKTSLRARWNRENPDLVYILDKWGYSNISKAETPIVLDNY